MNEQTAADTKNLVSEIFSLTGQKVEVDDPIVVAALIHSQLIRRAGQDAMTSIQSAVSQSVAELDAAVKAEREAAANISQATAEAYTQIVAAAKAATEAEVPKMQAEFSKIAQDVLAKIRKDASASAPHGWKVKVALATAGLVLLGGLAGGVIGAAWSGKRATLTEEQTQQIAAGKDFLQLLGQLDQPTKERLIKLVQKNHE